MKISLRSITTISPTKITIFVIFFFLVLYVLDFPFMRFMELKAYDLRMSSRGRLAPANITVIAAIDEKSLKELGRWPWPRIIIARLVEKLKAYGVKAVGFDVVFAEPEANAELKILQELKKETGGALRKIIEQKETLANTDETLAKAIAQAKNITLGYFFHISQKETFHLTEAEIEAAKENIASSRFPLVKASPNATDLPIVRAYAAVPNIKILSEAAENSGYFNAFPDTDGVIRWSPLVIKFKEGYYSSLALSLLQQYLDWPAVVLELGEFGVVGIKIDKTYIPTDDSGRLLINFLGPGKTFPHYSISDILNDRIPPEKLRGKIVLVGATATGIYDLRVTPYSTVYPGVEIHATVIDNIVRQNFLILNWWTKFLDVLSIIISGLIIGLIIPKLKGFKGVALGIAFVGLFALINIAIFKYYSTWLNLIFPVSTMMTTYLGITIYRYITEEREKKKIRNAFQYYLTPSVITEILKDPTKLRLGGVKKHLTVLFSDIRGFTSISEQMAPEDLVHLLNEYLTAMTNIVFKYEGLLDKYMGDAIMAVYGAPLDQPDHALRACKTALEMLKSLKVLQEKWSKEGKPYLNIGVGINSGDMVVGNMGSEMRFDYTVMGDSVNLASRLEGINKEYGTNIVISEFTYALVKEELYARELDAVRVKGKTLPVKIYELLCEKGEAENYRPFVETFEQALELYRQARWDKAIATFNEVLKLKPDDSPSLLYINRCEELRENPPPRPWDGVFTMTRK